ncbi:hypothetical protein A5717_10435 [Mycolicibacterium porcinum]|uniref:NAD(P)/FAD-dependent oxidoreductase n=1 Tax=Mycolicibacterium porcinum TaxID=39693 RepID=UPI00080BB711|nr:FAD-binding oxidoreductase [Mycolicibacterium porcinum]OCB14547.1 hypothetical protein A5717_10435 [Mycolicibacterium porcinum]
MSDLADVIVVGCGVQGLSVALNIARRGQRVIAVDRVGPGQQTSARAAGQSVIAQTDPAMGALMHRSIAGIVNFTAHTGIALPYHQVGSIKYACQEWSARQLEREVSRARMLGARVDMIDLIDAGKLAPHTDPTAATAAWYSPDDIYFEPPLLVEAMYQAALDAGVDFRFGVSVAGIVAAGGKVSGIDSTAGRFVSEAVVVAAGSWTAPLLEDALGTSLPLSYVRHQYSIRTAVPGINPSLPSVRVVDHAVYARPVGTDLMFGTYEPHPLTFDAAALPAHTEDVPLEAAAIDDALSQVARIFPTVTGSPVRQLRGGVVTMTPDGSYIIDHCDAAAGLYFSAGCNVMGLSVAPALGEDIAEWVITGRRPDSLAGFSASRFDGSLGASAELEGRALRQYEAIYRDEQSLQHVRVYGGGYRGRQACT